MERRKAQIRATWFVVGALVAGGLAAGACMWLVEMCRLYCS